VLENQNVISVGRVVHGVNSECIGGFRARSQQGKAECQPTK